MADRRTRTTASTRIVASRPCTGHRGASSGGVVRGGDGDTGCVHGKRAVHDMIEIGRRLIDARGRCKKRGWEARLEQEFNWTDTTARNYISMAEAAGKWEKFSHFARQRPLPRRSPR